MLMPCLKLAMRSGKNLVQVALWTAVGTSRGFGMETIWCSLSRCPGASHQRVALERRKTSKTQTETENENGTTILDLPGTLSPETDCSGTGTGTVPVERNQTSASLPAWTEEPGLDNPAFEESAIADSMCHLPLLFSCFQIRHLLLSYCSLQFFQPAFFLFKK